ncbi:Tudor/PWWP/MBT superfamily protein [Abeliophyllum distichum]|uniref:Tudor/PWWP/MBT superfamily protein n=1 Tax=Abeliophyllum distichum TaxID=126358 RepID=A0ABD1SXS2_9LAMI
MVTLKELAAASKILGESAGELAEESETVDHSGLKLRENGFRVSELNKVDGNEENGVENANFVPSDDKSVSVREEECNQNGINLIVDVLGSLDGGDENKNFFENNSGEDSSAENRGGLNITCVLDITGGDYKEEDGQVVEKQEHGFCVGDFVWGKIKSHPWWPGQIYDPRDASDFAVKHSKSGSLLVGFFGDGSGSWCLPAQLIPFANNFEEMSKESISKSFLNAVQRSIDEVGRVLESEMTCKCIAKESKVDLARPLVVNAGLKAGVLVPEVDVNRLLVPRYEPAEVLAKVTNLAQAVSIGSMLELAVLKSWLSAFYCAKGSHKLPVYYEPHQIEGLEDTSEIGDEVANGFGVPILGPLEDDWLSSPSSGNGKFPATSRDKIYQRRKQKSVAELMGETSEIKPKNKKKTMAKEGTDTAKSTSTTRKNSTASDGEDSCSHGPSSTGRKGKKRKGRISGSSRIMTNKVSHSESVDVGSVKGIHGGPLSSTLRVNEISSVENSIGEEGNEEPQKAAILRERKKSKYLSPPYTNLKWRAGNSSSKGESEIESEKIAKIARVGERMTKDDGDFFPSPPISNPVSEKVLPSRQRKGNDSSRHTSPQQDENDLKKIFDRVDVDASGNGVLSKVQSAAVDPLYLSKEGSLSMVREFFSAFRSSIYLDGSNYKEFHGRRRGMKRELLHSDPENQGNGPRETEPMTSQRQAGTKKIEEANCDTTKLKKTARVSSTKSSTQEIDKSASSASLVITYSPGFTLPSKDDIIRTFSMFGSLNEEETNLVTDSNTVQVEYAKNSDAEEAFRSSVNEGVPASPLHNRRLLHSSSTSEKPNSSVLADDVISDMGFINQKLERMTRVLENCDCKISPEKSSLKDEMKHLLEKVGTTVEKVRIMAETTSS